MSFSRRVHARGFSAGAVFLVATLLSVAGVAMQSTFPLGVPAASQGAALESGVTGASTITTTNPDGAAPSGAASNVTLAANAAPASSQTKAPVKPGKDVIEILISGQQEVNLYFPVCPPTPPDQSAKMKQAAKQLQSIPTSNSSPNQFGMPGTRCKPDPNNAANNTNRLVPANPGAWPQWTLYCEDKGLPGTSSSGSVAAGTTRDITDDDVNAISQDLTNTKYACKMLPPGTQPSKSPDELAQIAQTLSTTPPAQQAAYLQGQNLNQADQSALNQALGQQTQDISTQKQDLVDSNQQINAQLIDLANNGCSSTDTQVSANTANQQVAAGEVADAAGCQQQIAELKQTQADNTAKIASFDKQLNNLAAAQVALNPNTNPDPNKPPPNQPPANPVPPTQSPPYTGGGGGGGGGFNNPGLGANNTPQSPFGGACTTRYICSGSTLYYQSTNSYGMGANPYGGYPVYPPAGGQGQCMTQPIQQCQYGCQQPYGAGTSGAQSTLGGFMAGLQIVSAISSMFGGGSSNNNSANNNLPSQCATQPQNQQQQSPYGSGTNGQPCYQPPQQPDPSQCTSGSWQPTSAQQNGCTTGWQCVPGNGSAGDKPTAQLSCQPQVADVGMPISFSYACGNASGSTGTGFSTGGHLSGNATTSAPNPPSGQNTATFTLTCIKLGVTASSQCQVQLNKPGIVLVTNPKNVNGSETSLIGWITSGMQSCVVSSPDQQDFTERNAGNTSVNGAATTSPITGNTRFQLDCQTLSGGTKSATTTVSLN